MNLLHHSYIELMDNTQHNLSRTSTPLLYLNPPPTLRPSGSSPLEVEPGAPM